MTGSPTRRTLAGVAILAALAVAARVPYMGAPPFPDEGGYLIVADRWHTGGPGLYGGLWVDRPPLLMLFWRAAAALGGVEPARWMACGFVVLFVLAAGWSGWLVGGHRAARWAALTGAALVCSPILGTREVDGELLAAPLVLLACALALTSVRPTGSHRPAWAFLAGILGACAVLIKQNFADAFVFAAVLVVLSAARQAVPWRSGLRILGAGIAGACVPLVATVTWAVAYGPGPRALWYTLYGFRSDALRVILHQSMAAPQSRLATMLGLGVLSGVLVLPVVYLWSHRWELRDRDPFAVAVTTMLGFEAVSIAMGASYWMHYLIGLAPGVSLAAAGLATPRIRERRRPLVVAGFVAASAAVTVVGAPLVTLHSRATSTSLDGFLRTASRTGDSAVVTYGHANLLRTAGLEPAYPYLWSLPMRTLDPRLDLLTATIAGDDAPTWVIEWEPFDSWDIDARGRLARAVHAHYRTVARYCGVRVFLHDGVRRPVPAAAQMLTQGC